MACEHAPGEFFTYLGDSGWPEFWILVLRAGVNVMSDLTTLTVLTSEQTADVIRVQAEESGMTPGELAGLLLTLAVGDVYGVSSSE